jgi:hypothetical protein
LPILEDKEHFARLFRAVEDAPFGHVLMVVMRLSSSISRGDKVLKDL